MTRSQQLDELVGSVEALLEQLPDELGPEVAQLRDRVDAGIFEAWSSIANEGKTTLNRASQRAVPWYWSSPGLLVLVGIAALLVIQLTRRANYTQGDFKAQDDR